MDHAVTHAVVTRYAARNDDDDDDNGDDDADDDGGDDTAGDGGHRGRLTVGRCSACLPQSVTS